MKNLYVSPEFAQKIISSTSKPTEPNCMQLGGQTRNALGITTTSKRLANDFELGALVHFVHQHPEGGEVNLSI